MISAIRHTGLVVADLDKALKFWCEILGFKISKQMEESGTHIDAMLGLSDVKLTTVKLVAPDNNMLELLKFHTHPDKQSWVGNTNSTGFTHMAFTVTNIDDICEKLTKFGATLNALPQLAPDGSVKVTYAKSPEGVFVELVEVLKI